MGRRLGNERCPAVGHPVEVSLSKGREHLRVGTTPVEADHDRALSADLDELVDHRGEVDRELLRLEGGEADRTPGLIDDEGVVSSPLGHALSRVVALCDRPCPGVGDKVIIDEVEPGRALVCCEHR